MTFPSSDQSNSSVHAALEDSGCIRRIVNDDDNLGNTTNKPFRGGEGPGSLSPCRSGLFTSVSLKCHRSDPSLSRSLCMENYRYEVFYYYIDQTTDTRFSL